MGVFIYKHIYPYLIIITLLIKLRPTDPFNTQGLFPGTVFWKLLFQHDGDTACIVLQGGLIDLDIYDTIKVVIKIPWNGNGR